MEKQNRRITTTTSSETERERKKQSIMPSSRFCQPITFAFIVTLWFSLRIVTRNAALFTTFQSHPFTGKTTFAQ